MRFFNLHPSGAWFRGKIAAGSILGLLMGSMGLVTAHTQAQAQTPSGRCEWLSRPRQTNTDQQADVIVIGAISSRPYLVIIPGANASTLAAIRPCITDAFLTRSRLGPYLQAGAFSDRADAVALANRMVEEGWRMRVVHRRGISAFN